MRLLRAAMSRGGAARRRVTPAAAPRCLRDVVATAPAMFTRCHSDTGARVCAIHAERGAFYVALFGCRRASAQKTAREYRALCATRREMRSVKYARLYKEVPEVKGAQRKKSAKTIHRHPRMAVDASMSRRPMSCQTSSALLNTQRQPSRVMNVVMRLAAAIR